MSYSRSTVSPSSIGASPDFISAERSIEDPHSVFERLAEALLFLLQHRLDARLLLDQFRIGRAHLGDHVLDELVKNGFVLSELVAVTDRAPDDPPQHVAAPFVAGNHAVGDQERAGADVIGDDLSELAAIAVPILGAGLARRCGVIRFWNRSIS